MSDVDDRGIDGRPPLTSAVAWAPSAGTAYSDDDGSPAESMTGESPDRALVDAVLSGDDEAFRVLVDREGGNVMALCRRMLGDRQEAEDVAQEAFLQAYRALPTFRGDGPFGAWVRRIAIRIAIARLKRPVELRADPTRAEGWLERPAEGLDPQLIVLDDERRSEVVEAVSTLPEAQRRVVAMRFFGDMSLEEISTATGTPLGTTKSRLHRALAALRGRLRP